MAELQTILSSGDITGIKLGGTTSGYAVMTYDEVIAAIIAEETTLAITTVNAATYDLLATDYILHVTYSATGACAITLPTAQVVAGRTVIIKDAGGLAGTNNITVDTEGAETIDGSATAVINSNYSAINIYSDGTNWFIY